MESHVKVSNKAGKSPLWWHLIPIDALSVVPIVRSEEASDSHIDLLVPRFRGGCLGWLQRRLPAERQFERLVLDARGSTIWRALGSEVSIEHLIMLYCQAHPEDVADAEARVLRFLAAMETESFVRMQKLDERP